MSTAVIDCDTTPRLLTCAALTERIFVSVLLSPSVSKFQFAVVFAFSVSRSDARKSGFAPSAPKLTVGAVAKDAANGIVISFFDGKSARS